MDKVYEISPGEAGSDWARWRFPCGNEDWRLNPGRERNLSEITGQETWRLVGAV